jgi:hypothetical protein
MLAMMDWAEKYDVHTEVPKPFIDALRSDPEQLRKDILDNIVHPQ